MLFINDIISKIITNKANLLLDTKAILGEGPVWDWKKQLLYWVAIEASQLYAFNPANGETQRWIFNEMLGAAVPTLSGEMIMGFEKGLALFNFESETLLPLNILENQNSELRYNDGKVAPNGAFFIGSMHKQFVHETGNLYVVKPDFKTAILIPKTTISNGMAWTSDTKKFYFIDSPTFEVSSFDFIDSSLSNRKLAFKIPKNYGAPDGMCIDNEDMLWIAHWGGHCVRRWNPKTGEVLETIEVPAPHVTSCCFGGKDLKTLYITTARSGLSSKQLEEFPLSGGVFSHTSKVVGTPITYFKN